MGAHGILPLLLAAGLAGSGSSGQVVVFDAWWTTGYANAACKQAKIWNKKNAALIAQMGCDHVSACPQMMSTVNACTGGSASDVRAFKDNLVGEFAANPACNDVRFVSFDGPSDVSKAVARAVAQPHWTLSFDYAPGSAKQHWWLERPTKHAPFMGGKDAPKEVAAKVCAIVKRNGATVEN